MGTSPSANGGMKVGKSWEKTQSATTNLHTLQEAHGATTSLFGGRRSNLLFGSDSEEEEEDEDEETEGEGVIPEKTEKEKEEEEERDTLNSHTLPR